MGLTDALLNFLALWISCRCYYFKCFWGPAFCSSFGLLLAVLCGHCQPIKSGGERCCPLHASGGSDALQLAQIREAPSPLHPLMPGSSPQQQLSQKRRLCESQQTQGAHRSRFSKTPHVRGSSPRPKQRLLGPAHRGRGSCGRAEGQPGSAHQDSPLHTSCFCLGPLGGPADFCGFFCPAKGQRSRHPSSKPPADLLRKDRALTWCRTGPSIGQTCRWV